MENGRFLSPSQINRYSSQKVEMTLERGAITKKRSNNRIFKVFTSFVLLRTVQTFLLIVNKNQYLSVSTNLSQSTPDNETVVKVPVTFIDRVYYFNSFQNPLRRAYVEGWLEKYQLPYQRIEALAGVNRTHHCKSEDTDCLLRLRLSNTYKYLVSNAPNYYNTSGTVLILEHDDIEIADFFALKKSLKGLPKDWKVARLDCMNNNEVPSNSSKQQNQQQPQVVKLITRDDNFTWSGATLWKDRSLAHWLRRRLVGNKRNKMDSVLLNFPTLFKSYCLNVGVVVKSTMATADPLKTPMASTASWAFPKGKVNIDHLQKQVLSGQTYAINQTFGASPIDRIYYINMEKNVLRRQAMESWLQNQPTPYKRIKALIGLSSDECKGDKGTTKNCRGIVGLLHSLVSIIDNENTTGLSLVVEDDYALADPGHRRLQEALKMIPDDWDLIRFDCWGETKGVKLREINQFVFDPLILGYKGKGARWFCGGTHSMLWKGTSVHKLKEMWSKVPSGEADCQISYTPSVKSYCVNIGLGDLYQIESEKSDID